MQTQREQKRDREYTNFIVNQKVRSLPYKYNQDFAKLLLFIEARNKCFKFWNVYV